jgi:hypothetical protein
MDQVSPRAASDLGDGVAGAQFEAVDDARTNPRRKGKGEFEEGIDCGEAIVTSPDELEIVACAQVRPSEPREAGTTRSF